MSTATYEDALRVAQQLTPDELQRLSEELAALARARIEANLDPEAQAYLDSIDQLAARIGAAWRDGVSAVDAVREGRREL